jgi:hypothetical protein
MSSRMTSLKMFRLSSFQRPNYGWLTPVHLHLGTLVQMPSRQVDPLFTPCSLLIDTSRYFISIQDQRRLSLLLSTSQPCANLLAVFGSTTARNRTRGRSPQASAHRPGNDFAIFVRRFAILDGFGFIVIPANHESPQTLLTQTSLWKVRDKRKPVTVSGMISSPREPVTPVLFPTKLVP